MITQKASIEIDKPTRRVRESPGKFSPRLRFGLVLLKALHWVVRVPSRLLILFVRGYQVTLSPLLGNRCRFHPSCSQYFIEAVRKYGAIRGAAKGLWRLARCHPFNPGGYDPP
jgi:putative membrane protein insertion efficiency factor